MSSPTGPVRRRHAARSAGAILAFTASSLPGCGRQKTATVERAPPSASASARSMPPPSAAPSSQTRTVWCAGAWTGTYRAAALHIELPTNRGGIPEWKADDGKSFVGPGTIELTCAEDGTVVGSAHGALGDHEIRGDTGDESLHARLVPKAPVSPPAFSGTVTVSRTGTAVTGELRASTLDGHVARTAAVTLTKAGE